MQTRNIAAYTAWIVALGAILMPPAVAEAGLALVSDAPQVIYTLLEEPSVLDATRVADSRRGVISS